MEHRLKAGQLMDKELQRQFNAEKIHWRNVLQRLLAIVQFLAQRNIAFRGTLDKLDDQNNGNFLGIVQLFAQFDPVLCEHIRRIRSNEIHDHYLGKDMQNEFIQLLSNAVVQKITDIIISPKYYSVILDCTPDVSHVEQLTVILRCVQIVGTSIDVTEHFVGFVVAEESTGLVAVRYCEPYRPSHSEEASLHPGLYKRLRAVVVAVFSYCSDGGGSIGPVPWLGHCRLESRQCQIIMLKC